MARQRRTGGGRRRGAHQIESDLVGGSWRKSSQVMMGYGVLKRSQGMEFGELGLIPSHNLTYRCHAYFFFIFWRNFA